jgi:hypothetical protein
MELEDRFRVETNLRDSLKRQIIELSTQHSVLTRFTAFVVVDETEIVNQDGTRRKIVQPVEMPADWEMQDQVAMPSLTMAGSAAFRMPAPAAIPVAPPPPMQPLSEIEFTGYKASAAPPPVTRQSKTRSQTPPGARSEGLMDLLEEAFSTAAEAVTEAFRGLSGKQGELQASHVQPTQDQNLFQLFSLLDKALNESLANIKAGIVPPASGLEAARIGLLNALSGSPLAASLPELQRFLRSAMVDLVAALQTPSITTTILLPLFEQHLQTFEKVKQEVLPHLNQPPSPGGSNPGSFWESSI